MKPFRKLWLVPVIFLILGGSPLQAGAQNIPKEKTFRIERSMPKEAVACIECHKREHPGLFADWANSRHATANITCYDCHQAEESDPDVSQAHYQQYERSDQAYGTREYKVPIAAVVTPKDCSRCHPDEAKAIRRQQACQYHGDHLENRSLAE